MAIPESLLPPPKTSWQQIINKLPPEAREEAVKTLTDVEMAAISNDTFLSTRREQFSPMGLWFLWIIMAGRGWGKTYVGSNWIVEQHQNGTLKNSGIVAATSADMRRFCIDGPSGVLSQSPPWFKPDYKPSQNKLIWPNGSETLLFTSEKPDRLRGPNLDGVWCDELSYWRYLDDAWNNLMFCLRYQENPQCVITMTPRPVKLIRTLLDRHDTILTRGSLYDNKDNLSASYIERVKERYEGTRLGRQEIWGELLEDVEGALWNLDLIDKTRVSTPGKAIRVGIGVDPSTTSGENANETGIIVANLNEMKHVDIVEDRSLHGSPNKWGQEVVNAYRDHEANFVIAEKNQGGEMVSAIIHNIDDTIPIELVHAKKSKFARAEPVAALYEQGRVHHVGNFPVLEDQMCTYVPGESDESPDRLDAGVYVVTKLLVETMNRAGTWGRGA